PGLLQVEESGGRTGLRCSQGSKCPMAITPLFDLFEGSLQPPLDPLQDEAIADPPGQRLPEIGMRDRVVVAGQVAAYHLGCPLPTNRSTCLAASRARRPGRF